MTVYNLEVYGDHDVFDKKVELDAQDYAVVTAELSALQAEGKVNDWVIEEAGHEIYTYGSSGTIDAVREHLGLYEEGV